MRVNRKNALSLSHDFKDRTRHQRNIPKRMDMF